MPSGVTLILIYLSLIYHFHTLVSCVTHICAVDLILKDI
jgi:hypothetical protein